MQEPQRSPSTWRVGIDLAAFLALAVVAGVAAAVTLAGIAVLLTGAGSSPPAASPAPIQAPAARTIVAEGTRAH